MAEAVVPKAWKWNVIIRFLSQLFAAKCCFALLKSNRKSVSWKGEFIFTVENRLCKLMTSILMEKCTDAYSFIDFLLQNSICFKFSFKKFTVFQIGLKSIAFSIFILKYERSIIQFYLHYLDTETSLEIFKHCVTKEANAIKNADNIIRY